MFANTVTTTPQVDTFASQTSGWTATAPFAQFNPALGTLDEIQLNVSDTDTGTFAAENLEAMPASVWMSETAALSVAVPGPSSSVTATATNSDYFALGAFDGSADFAGPSGRSEAVADSTAAHGYVSSGGLPYGFPEFPNAINLTDSAALAAFTGTGTIAPPVSDAGSSLVTGPANLFSEITQQSGGTVSISYVYTPRTGTSGAGTSETGASVAGTSGPMQGFAHSFAIGNAGAPGLNLPGMMFIGALQSGDYVTAKPNETFLIGSGASATIGDFSLSAGDALNLDVVLGGAPLAHDLSHLGSFLNVTGQSVGIMGEMNTTLAIGGPGSAASLVLESSVWESGVWFTVLDLLNSDALILPGH